MNSVDATCEVCGQPIRWAGVTARICVDCVGTAKAVNDTPTVEKPEARTFAEWRRFDEWRKRLKEEK